MNTVDLGPLAQSFIDSIPTLELAQFSVTGHRRRKSDDARIEREGVSFVLERDIFQHYGKTPAEPKSELEP